MGTGRIVIAAAMTLMFSILAPASTARADSWVTNVGGQITTTLTSPSKVGMGVNAAPTSQVEIRANSLDGSVPRVALKVNQIRSDGNIAEFKQNNVTKVFINAAGVLQAD